MSTVRVLFFVLLSVMLPVRGVLAAALLCPPHVAAAAVEVDHHDHDDQRGMAQAPHGADCAHHAGADGATAGHDRCNLCSACCSVPPVPSSAPAVPQPHDEAAMPFPSWAAPAPTFQSEGPERPPRRS